MRRNQCRHLDRLRMMHDHVLHKLHIRLRPWRKPGPRRRRKRPARLSRRPRLHHCRLRRITLLCARSGAEGSCGSARSEQHATEHDEYSRRVELPLAAKTIKPPLPCTAKYFHLDSEESLPLNTNTFKNCFQAEATCPFEALRTSLVRCVSESPKLPRCSPLSSLTWHCRDLPTP